MSKKSSVKALSDWVPPKGLSISRRADRDTWLVAYRIPGEGGADSKRKLVKETFATKGLAVDRAKELAGELKLRGESGLRSLSGRAVSDYERILDSIGDATIDQLLAVWDRHKREVLGGDVKLLLAAAVAEFLKLRKNEGLPDDSLGPMKKRLSRLSAVFGDKPLVSVTTDELRAWLGGLHTESRRKKVRMVGEATEPVPQSKKAAGWTLINHYKSAHAFFERAVEERWIAENPMSRVKTPPKPKDEITVMSVDDGIKLLEANKDDPVSLRLALEMFGALRYSSTGRLLADHLKTEQKGIHLPAKDHKSERRHFLQRLPDNLWKWVDKWKDDERAWEKLSKRMLQYHKTKAFARAGVPHPHNVLRHSFCSYHIAKHGDAAKTAVLLQHTNQKMLYDHYCGYATEGDAERWFNIVP